MMEIKEQHITEVFYKNAALRGDMPFLGYKEQGVWKTISWREAERRARNFALGLASLGVVPGDHVAIFSPNRPEWGLSDIAILSNACADIPIYPTNSSEETEYILNDSGSKIVIVAEKMHFDRVMAIRENVPTLTHIITMDRIEGAYNGGSILHFDDVMELGAAHEDPGELDRRMASIKQEDMATLIYTSGTTGPPKGVILTHKNFLSNMYQAHISHPNVFVPGQKSLSFLPLSHSLERTAGWYLMIFEGGTVYYAEDPTTVVDNMQELRPDFVVSVPRLFEKIYSGIVQKVEKASPFKKAMFNFASTTGAEAAEHITQNKPLPLGLTIRYALAKKLVLNKLKIALGADNIKVFVSGGGPLSVEVNKFFHSLGMTVHEGYGLTETTPITNVVTFEDFRFGTVGKPVADTQIKIAEDGEILIKGPQVMKGYYNKPEATAEAFDEDGWFLTGDIGEVNDGFLKITDRKKALIITAGGKNISPANIEGALITNRYIENAVAIGDARPFITALIVPDFEALHEWAEEKGITAPDNAMLVKDPEVLALFKEQVDLVNERFARVEQVKKFSLMDHSFTQETGELTPTMKLKRKVVNTKYADDINGLYG